MHVSLGSRIGRYYLAADRVGRLYSKGILLLTPGCEDSRISTQSQQSGASG